MPGGCKRRRGASRGGSTKKRSQDQSDANEAVERLQLAGEGLNPNPAFAGPRSGDPNTRATFRMLDYYLKSLIIK